MDPDLATIAGRAQGISPTRGGGGAGGLAYEPQQQMVRPSRRALLKPTWLPRRLGLADRGQRAGVGEEALT
jgi:hypothetical protein